MQSRDVDLVVSSVVKRATSTQDAKTTKNNNYNKRIQLLLKRIKLKRKNIKKNKRNKKGKKIKKVDGKIERKQQNHEQKLMTKL